MLSNVLSYKGYNAEFGFSKEDDTFHGRVIGINSVIDFFGDSIVELKREFTKSIDEYLAYCAEIGVKPEKSWSGKLTLRPTEEQRRRYAIAAALAHKSVNAWMVDVLDQKSKEAELAVVAAE